MHGFCIDIDESSFIFSSSPIFPSKKCDKTILLPFLFLPFYNEQLRLMYKPLTHTTSTYIVDLPILKIPAKIAAVCLPISIKTYLSIILLATFFYLFGGQKITEFLAFTAKK